jgi:hypothetical protein
MMHKSLRGKKRKEEKEMKLCLSGWQVPPHHSPLAIKVMRKD